MPIPDKASLDQSNSQKVQNFTQKIENLPQESQESQEIQKSQESQQIADIQPSDPNDTPYYDPYMDSDPDIVLGLRLDMDRPPTEIENSARRHNESSPWAESQEPPKKKHKKKRRQDAELPIEDYREPEQEPQVSEISEKKKKKRNRQETENPDLA
jgi:hypothetical protein